MTRPRYGACEALRRPSRRTTRERTRARGFLDPKEEPNHTTAESSLLSVGVMLHFTHYIPRACFRISMARTAALGILIVINKGVVWGRDGRRTRAVITGP